MSTLNTKYIAPTDLATNSYYGQGTSGTAASPVYVGRGSDTRYWAWKSKYSTFQIRWKYRDFLLPEDGSVTEGEWGDYSEWMCDDPDLDASDWDNWDASNTIAFGSGSTDYHCHVAGFSKTDLDTTIADRREYTVQIRAYNEPTTEHGVTYEDTYELDVPPDIEVLSLTYEDSDSTILAELRTDYASRVHNLSYSAWVYGSKPSKPTMKTGELTTNSANEGYLTITPSDFGFTAKPGQKVTVYFYESNDLIVEPSAQQQTQYVTLVFAALNDKFVAPTELGANAEITQTGYSGWVSESMAVNNASHDNYYWTWLSPYSTFQIRWRWRDRLLPTDTTNDIGDWDNWSAWTCDDTSLDAENWDNWDCKNTIAFGNRTGTPHTHTAGFAVADLDTTLADRREYEVQVRAYNETSNEFGVTYDDTFLLYYRPSITVKKATLGASGELRITVDTDAAWGDNRVQVCVWLSENEPVRKVYISRPMWASPRSGETVEAAFRLDDDDYNFNADIGDEIVVSCKTINDLSVLSTEQEQRVTIEPYSDTYEPNVTFEVIDNEDGTAIVSVKDDSAYDWTSISTAFKWYLPWGGRVDMKAIKTEVVSKTGSNKEIRYTVCPPLQQNWQARTIVTTVATDKTKEYSTGWVQLDKVTAGGAAFLIVDGVATAGVRYNMTLSSSMTPDSEVYKCAGREREISRYGVGGQHVLKITGYVLEDDDYKSDDGIYKSCNVYAWERVQKRGLLKDATLNLPGGYQYNVRVDTLDINRKHPDYAEISVSLTEVK